MSILEVNETLIVEEHLPVVKVSDLVIDYGSFRAVDGISFEIYPGEVVGFLGKNGAGKSSTLRALSTVNPPTSGETVVDGKRFSRDRELEQAKSVIGYCPDVGGIIRTATIREHIGLSLNLHKKNHLWSQALSLVEKFDLAANLDTPASGFSHGQSRRLSVVLAALSSDKLLILDEPFDGVDPVGVETTLPLISDAKNAGLAVIVSTHLQDILIRACDRILVVVDGKIVDQGTSEEFNGDSGKQRYWKSLMENKA